MVTWPPSSSAAPLNYVLRRRMVMSMPSRCDPVSYFCLFQISPDNKALITLKNQTKKPRECKQPPQNIFLNWILPVGTGMRGGGEGCCWMQQASTMVSARTRTQPTQQNTILRGEWISLLLLLLSCAAFPFNFVPLIRGFLQLGGCTGNFFPFLAT